MATHRCPYCRSRSVRRSRRRGFGEDALLRALFIRPFRCQCCYRRHYGFAFLSKNPGTRTYKSGFASLLQMLPQPAPLAAGLLAVLLILGSSGSKLMSLGLANLAGLAASEPSPDVARAGLPTAAAPPRAWLTRVAGREFPPQREVRQLPLSRINAEMAAVSLVSPPADPQQEALGSVRATGEVVLNGSAVPQMATIFSGDTLRTGADGNAAVEIQGNGTVQVSPQSLLKFTKSPRYMAELSYGHITSRSLRGAANFQVRAGNFIVVPDPERPEMTAEIVRAPDGAIRVKAVQGSVGIIELEGAQATFIRNGDEVSITADGKIETNAPSQASLPPSPQAAGGGGHTALIGLGLGAAAAAGVGIALASGGGESNPVSASAP